MILEIDEIITDVIESSGSTILIKDDLDLNNKKITNVNLPDYVKSTELVSIMKYKGSVATPEILLAINNPKLGDVYNVISDDNNYVWNGSMWDKLGGLVNLSGYQPLLQAGDNITIDENNVISASGGYQPLLQAGDNITIDENNVISASGGGGDGIDLNMLGYMNYAADLFYRARRQSLFSNAWEHSLTVIPLEISENSLSSSPRGTAQYPNGETEGVIIPNSVTSIGTSAFQNWTSNNQPLVIPNSVTSIGTSAFQNWTSNNQPLVIPNSVTSIGTYAFRNWTSNNQPLVIPNSVTNIGNYAFQDWVANNQPLVIPNSVTNIGNYAFQDWVLVPYVEIQAITPPTLANANAFDGQNNAPIYVPNESVDDYKTANNWVDLASRIFPINGIAIPDVDLTDYYNKTEIDNIIGDIATLLGVI